MNGSVAITFLSCLLQTQQSNFFSSVSLKHTWWSLLCDPLSFLELSQLFKYFLTSLSSPIISIGLFPSQLMYLKVQYFLCIFLSFRNWLVFFFSFVFKLLITILSRRRPWTVSLAALLDAAFSLRTTCSTLFNRHPSTIPSARQCLTCLWKSCRHPDFWFCIKKYNCYSSFLKSFFFCWKNTLD